MKLEITPIAYQELKSCFKNKNQKPVIRIWLNEKGCHGPSLKMILHESDAVNDELFTYDDFDFALDKPLAARMQVLEIDFVPGQNFRFKADNPEIGSRCMGCYVGMCLNNDFIKKKPSVSPFIKKTNVDKNISK